MKPPLLILSMERSGSTLLRRLLDTHDQIHGPDELHIGALCHQLCLLLSANLPDIGSDAAGLRAIAVRDPTLRTVRTVVSEGSLAQIRSVVSGLVEPFLVARGKSLLRRQRQAKSAEEWGQNIELNQTIDAALKIEVIVSEAAEAPRKQT